VVARSFAAPEVQWILYGLFMILIVFVLPQGIVPAIEKWFGVRDQAKAMRDQSKSAAAAKTSTAKATAQDVR
jgi:hypothetical protein